MTSHRSLILVGLTAACCLFVAGSFSAAAAPDQTSAASSTALAYESMEPYTQTLPGSELSIEMVPIRGGVVRVSVAAFDAEDPSASPEAPMDVEVELPPFWISRHEITWQSYWEYMALDASYTSIRQIKTLKNGTKQSTITGLLATRPALDRAVKVDPLFGAVDAVTAPTELYDSSTTYESGEEPNLPAVSMTTFAAKQFTKWLSSVSGTPYRLPSEAEWEHAARAGEEPPEDIDSVAWYVDNADWVARPVGQKQPNAWGLHDTLGNVAELVLDAARPDGRPELAGKRVGWKDAIAWPTGDYPMIAKGGHYDSEVEEVSTTVRLVSNPEWKDADPNLPKSPWWFASYPSNGVGFRIVRPTTPIDSDLIDKVWGAAAESVARAVDDRLREGRGKIGWIDPELPAAIEQLEDDDVQSLIK